VTPREDETSNVRLHVCDVVNRKGETETAPCFTLLPFICKVEAKDAPYNSECDVFGKGKNSPG
jgi:hypothetical protein